jgi:hypothetical protein
MIFTYTYIGKELKGNSTNERYIEKNKLIHRKEQWKKGKETTLTL